MNKYLVSYTHNGIKKDTVYYAENKVIAKLKFEYDYNSLMLQVSNIKIKRLKK